VIIASAAGDAVTVGLAIGVIMAFTACALARIFLRDVGVKANRAAERLEQSMYGYEPQPVPVPPVSPVVLPPERRTRTPVDTLPGMDVSWDEASPEQRAEAVLAALPLHYEDANGVSAKDVAHRLGIRDRRAATRVAPMLRALHAQGKVRTGQSAPGRRGKVYWRVGEPGG
jgi:hypothetical protein